MKIEKLNESKKILEIYNKGKKDNIKTSKIIEEINSILIYRKPIKGAKFLGAIINSVKGVIKNNDISNKVIEEINDEVQSIKKYEIIEEKNEKFYMLTHKTLNKVFKLKVKLIDNIFKDYSKHGLNLTGEEILQKYKLKPEVWTIIKSRLRLYKASDVISPYTSEISTDEELKVIIDEAIDESLTDVRDKFVETYDKKFKKVAMKDIKQQANFEYQLSLFTKAIENYKPKKIKLNKLKTKDLGVADIVITDLHIGKKNSDRILEDIERIKNDTINLKENEVNIICLGDIGENFGQDPMHPGQHIHLDKTIPTDPHELKIYISEMFQQLLIDIRQSGKKVNFIGLVGNHDRHTKSNGDDLIRSAGLDIYEFMKQGLKNTDIDVNYLRKSINTYSTKTKHYILSHGEWGFNKRNVERVLWDYGRQDLFNVILSGHTHQHIQQVGQNYVKVVVAPLAGAGEYDERLGLRGEVGFTRIRDSELGGIEIQNIILK